MTLSLTEFSLYDRVLLHLSNYAHVRRTDIDHPAALTHDGIAQALGRTRADMHISVKLIVERGWATKELHRVIGHKQLVLTVLLTDSGIQEAAKSERIAALLGATKAEAIRAPPKVHVGVAELMQKCRTLERQMADLRQQVEALSGGAA